MKTQTSTKFARDCKACEEKTGVDFYIDARHGTNRSTEVCEDDGALIIEVRKERAVFSIGQDLPLKEQNERITSVLEFLKLERFLKGNVLHSQDSIEREEEEDDDYCPHCGRGH